MTSRERVEATLVHQPVDRAPRHLWALPYVSLFRSEELAAMERRFPPDIASPQVSPGTDADEVERLRRPGSYVDEWGSHWEVAEPGVIGEVKQPAIGDWAALENWQPPWHLVRGLDLSRADRGCEQSSQFMLSPVCARPFERMQFLRGTENVFMDLADGTPAFFDLLARVHGFYRETVQAWARSKVDGIFLMDDWGTNRSLLVSLATWREVFKPLYRDYCEIIKSAGKKVFFHSDGHIAAIMEDLVEFGVDGLNSQLFCMDLEAIAARFRGRITFWGEIDRQHVLPFGNTHDVREAVRRVRRALDRGRGGVIAQCEWGVDNPAANIATVFDTWLEPLDGS